MPGLTQDAGSMLYCLAEMFVGSCDLLLNGRETVRNIYTCLL